MRIVHFELPADDPARCMRFYERAFGWRFDKWDGPTEGTPFGIIQFDPAAA
jgi:uncharacterized protein